MNVERLIEILSSADVNPKAEVYAFDADEAKFVPLTGIIHDEMIIELHTDSDKEFLDVSDVYTNVGIFSADDEPENTFIITSGNQIVIFKDGKIYGPQEIPSVQQIPSKFP